MAWRMNGNKALIYGATTKSRLVRFIFFCFVFDLCPAAIEGKSVDSPCRMSKLPPQRHPRAIDRHVCAHFARARGVIRVIFQNLGVRHLRPSCSVRVMIAAFSGTAMKTPCQAEFLPIC